MVSCMVSVPLFVSKPSFAYHVYVVRGNRWLLVYFGTRTRLGFQATAAPSNVTGTPRSALWRTQSTRP